MEAAKHYGLTDNEWVDSIRDRIEYINPASEALTMTIEEREPKQVVTEDGEKEEVKPKTKAERQLERAMEQIAKVMELRVPVDQKIQQLKQIELTAKRKISEEKEKIKEYKNELEIE